jgi:predicted transcriptional regulator
MTPQSRQVSDSELEILKVLWDLEQGTVRDVLAKLPASGRTWAYTTAQTLMNRLQEKGFLERSKEGRAFVFRPTVSRDELLGESLDALAKRVCDGAALPLLLNLVQSSKFSPRDLRRFRELLDELEGGR